MVGSAKKSDVELQVAEGSQAKAGEQLAAIKFRAIASPGKVAGLHNDGKVVMEVRALTKNVRISPELHKQAALIAIENQTTLNSFVESSIKQAVIAGG